MTRECWNTFCRNTPSGNGSGVFICVHEHMVTEGDYCTGCWTSHLLDAVAGRLLCTRCARAAPPDGHDCLIRLLSAVPGKKKEAAA